MKITQSLTIFALILTISISAVDKVSAVVSSTTDTTKKELQERKEEKKVEKVKSVADKQLDQRIENLIKLKERVMAYKNVSDTDKTTIVTVIGNVISELNDLKSTIENATSSDVVKESREKITKNYRVYALVMPQLSLIASADRMTTMVSMMNIVATKLENRLGQVATGTDITTQNLASANKSLADLKAKLVQAQSDAQSAVTLVSQLVPDEGDKTVMESNQKALKDARAKIKSAQTNLVTAKKNAEAITKILGKEKKKDIKNATTTPTSNQ